MSFLKPAFHERNVEADARVQAKLEHKRAVAAARLDRILDPRQRTIGIDTAALEQQIREKEAARALAHPSIEAEEVKRQLAAVEAVERANEAARKAAAEKARHDLEEQIARKELADTWDLNDPKGLRKSLPPRLGDDDPRLGPSSVQVLAGEDPQYAQRKRLQQAQMAAWTAQQMAEKAARNADKGKDDAAYAAMLQTAAAVTGSLESAITAESRARAAEAAAYNLALAAAKQQQKALERSWEAKADEVTLATLNTPGAGMGLLAEEVTDGISAANPRRYRPDHYRGRPAEELSATSRAYQEQMAAKAAREAEARAREAEAVAARTAALRQAALMERATEEARAQAARQTREMLDRQAAEAAARREAEKAASKSNRIGDEFYSGFGRSAR